MKGGRKVFALFFAVCAVFALGVPSVIFATGITPATLDVGYLLPNASVHSHVSISRTDASQNQNVAITIGGPAAQYVTGEKTLRLPKGELLVPYPITIQTGSLAEGVYVANITVASTPTADDGKDAELSGISSVVAGVQGTVQFTVTNTTIQTFEIPQVTIPDTEENSFIGFTYVFKNTGTVDTRPTAIAIDIRDFATHEQLYSERILGGAIAPVAAHEEKEVGLATKGKLPIGAYRVHLTFYNGEAVVLETERPLQVVPAGTLGQQGVLETFTSNKPTYTKGELVQFTMLFHNTGETGVSVVPVIEVTHGNAPVETVAADPVFVLQGEQSRLERNFRVSSEGEYRAKGYVAFGQHQTNDIAIDFTVWSSLLYSYRFFLYGLCAAGVVGCIGWIFFRKK